MKTDSIIMPPLIKAFDQSRYPFRRLMESHLDVRPLELVHKYFGAPRISGENDQETRLHEAMYEIGSEFNDVYRSFMRDWVQSLLGDAVVFQAVPSFRYQPPGTVAVGSWHRDSDFGHGESEINVWVPLTISEETSSVWMESAPGKRDFSPVVVPLGSAMIFDAVSLTHGNVPNRTSNTRVSFEFRVIMESSYEPRAEKSVKQSKQFKIGHYFDKFPQS